MVFFFTYDRILFFGGGVIRICPPVFYAKKKSLAPKTKFLRIINAVLIVDYHVRSYPPHSTRRLAPPVADCNASPSGPRVKFLSTRGGESIAYTEEDLQGAAVSLVSYQYQILIWYFLLECYF